MARKTPSRMELRKQVEAAESQGADGDKKKRAVKKRPAAKRAKRVREKAPQRRRLVWAVLNAAMKEEARFPYDQREAAEEKIRQLRAKSDKPYFIQPIKELITESAETAAAEPEPATEPVTDEVER